MGQSSNGVVVKGALIYLSEEECVSGMGQSPNDAAVKDVQNKSSKEECVLGMGQRRNDALVMDAQMQLRKEDYARGTENTSTPPTNLQLLHHVLGQNLTKLL